MAHRIKDKQVERHVVLRASLIGGIALGLLLGIAAYMGNHWKAQEGYRWVGYVQAAVSLLLIWGFVSSTMRAIHIIRKNAPLQYLLAGGLLTVLGGAVVKEITLNGIKTFRDQASNITWNTKSILLILVIGIGVALISLIHIRVKNKYWGNILELVIAALFVGAFFWYMKRWG